MQDIRCNLLIRSVFVPLALAHFCPCWFSLFLFLSACNTFLSLSYFTPSLPLLSSSFSITLFSPFSPSPSVCFAPSRSLLYSSCLILPLANLTSHQKSSMIPHQVHHKQTTRLSKIPSPLLAPPHRMQMSHPPYPPTPPSASRTSMARPDPHSVGTVTPDNRSPWLDVSSVHWGNGLINQDNAGKAERSRFLFPAGKSLSGADAGLFTIPHPHGIGGTPHLFDTLNPKTTNSQSHAAWFQLCLRFSLPGSVRLPV